MKTDHTIRMSKIILLEAHETCRYTPRTSLTTVEIALNIDHINGMSTTVMTKFPGTSILLNGGGVMLVTQSEDEVWHEIENAHTVDLGGDFINIEHWENAIDDRMWVGGRVFRHIPRMNFWSR